MTPDDMAHIHALAFPGARGWSAGEIRGLVAEAGGFAVYRGSAFALGRHSADEAELLTLACAPEHRRQGHGSQTLAAFEAAAQRRGAASLFLEVAEDNMAARALYRAAGYQEVGRRKNYYRSGQDALVLQKLL